MARIASSAVPASVPPGAPGRTLLLGVLCVGAFAFPLSAFVVGPLLVDLSKAFDISLAQAGQLVSLAAIPSAVLSLFVGPLSDLYGRRPVLLVGATILGASALGSALAPSYDVLALMRVATGIGAALVGPATFAGVADLFSYQERGRAYALLLAAMNLSTILGMPAATLVAEQWSWRWAFAFVGMVMAASFVALLRLYPAAPPRGDARFWREFAASYAPVVRNRSAVAVFISTLAMSVGWMAFQTYFGAFFIYSYGITTGGLAPILAAAGLGVLIGTQIGGRLGDRIGHKAVTLWAIGTATLLITLLLLTTTTVEVAALINFVLSIPMGMRFTSLSVVISEAAPTARGTMNALNSTFFSVGMLGGALVGGVIVEGPGFAGLAALIVAGHLVAMVLLGLFLVDEAKPAAGRRRDPETGRIGTEVQPGRT